MFPAATAAEISPLRLGFTGTLKVIRRAISDFQDANSDWTLDQYGSVKAESRLN